MNGHPVDMPRIDATVTAMNLHERAQAVSVPCFDWLNQPIVAIVDGLTHPHRRRPPAKAVPADPS
jgi:hypothetical protein